jgi:hypothetical protein
MPRVAALPLALRTLAALGAPDPAHGGHGAPCLTCLADGVTQTRIVDGGRIIRMGSGLAPGPEARRPAR